MSQKAACYEEALDIIYAILDDESDWIAAMATVACELHNAFDHYHWTRCVAGWASDSFPADGVPDRACT